MKQIYNRTKRWKFAEEETIHDTTIFRHFTFLEPEKATTKSYDIDSFKTLELTAESGFFWNAEKRISIFGKTIIELPKKEEFSIPAISIKEKNFKPIELIESYELVTDLSLKNIYEELPAEDFIEYLKERGMQNEHIVF